MNVTLNEQVVGIILHFVLLQVNIACCADVTAYRHGVGHSCFIVVDINAIGYAVTIILNSNFQSLVATICQADVAAGAAQSYLGKLVIGSRACTGACSAGQSNILFSKGCQVVNINVMLGALRNATSFAFQLSFSTFQRLRPVLKIDGLADDTILQCNVVLCLQADILGIN